MRCARIHGVTSLLRGRALAAVATLLLAACESGDAGVSGPKGRDAFARFVAIGTGFSAGVQSGGLFYNSQEQAWPALLAHQAGAGFVIPLLRSPGCPPPRIAPVGLTRLLSGASSAGVDSSCAGTLATLAPPLDNLALPGATAWAALSLTPKLVAAAPTRYSAGDRARYPLVLASTQSQLTAALVLHPTLVGVELGQAEVLSAATSGLLVQATSYTQATPFTYVPAAIFAPEFAAISDSLKRRSTARVALLGVGRISNLVAFRTGGELAADRAGLAVAGVVVDANCDGNANLINTAAGVPVLVARAQSALAPQPLSCADVPGTSDGVLTPADVTALDAVVDQMNAQIKQVADQNGWGFVDVNAVWAAARAARAPYAAAVQLSCAYPYGQYVSLDGVQFNVAGQQLVANAAAAALNQRYGFSIPAVGVAPMTPSQLCP